LIIYQESLHDARSTNCKILNRSRFIEGPQPIGDNTHKEEKHVYIHILIETRKHDLYIQMGQTVRIFCLETKGKGKVHSVTDH
jgi:hypothetical protein